MSAGNRSRGVLQFVFLLNLPLDPFKHRNIPVWSRASFARRLLCLMGWWRGQESHQSWRLMVMGECTCVLWWNNMFKSTILTSKTIKLQHKSSSRCGRWIRQSILAFWGQREVDSCSRSSEIGRGGVARVPCRNSSPSWKRASQAVPNSARLIAGSRRRYSAYWRLIGMVWGRRSGDLGSSPWFDRVFLRFC